MQKETQLSLQCAIDQGLEFKPVEWFPDFFNEELNLYCYSFDSSEIQSRMSVATILDYFFNSDEVVVADLYALDGVPFALYQKYGDRNGYSVTPINKEIWKKFATELFQKNLEEEYNSRFGENKSLDDIQIAEGQDYICFSEDENQSNFSVHILSPKWQCGFRGMFDSHKAEYKDKPVSYVRWANDLRSWEENSKQVIVLLDGEEKEIDGRLINFVRIKKEN